MAHLSVVIRRVSDKVEVTHEYDVEEKYGANQEFWWAEGNAACDCNRAMFFDRERGEEKEDLDGTDYPCGDGAYLVKVTLEGDVVLDEIKESL